MGEEKAYSSCRSQMGSGGIVYSRHGRHTTGFRNARMHYCCRSTYGGIISVVRNRRTLKKQQLCTDTTLGVFIPGTWRSSKRRPVSPFSPHSPEVADHTQTAVTPTSHPQAHNNSEGTCNILSRIAKFLGTRRLSYFPLHLQNEYFVSETSSQMQGMNSPPVVV